MYNLDSGEKAATREGFGKAIVELGEEREDIVVLAASVGDSTKAYNFRDRFPERYVEAGIAEQNMIGLAAGLALGGKVPFASSFCAFLPGRCFDQIRQSDRTQPHSKTIEDLPAVQVGRRFMSCAMLIHSVLFVSSVTGASSRGQLEQDAPATIERPETISD